MDSVVTLICNPAITVIEPELAECAKTIIGERGGRVTGEAALAPGAAHDIFAQLANFIPRDRQRLHDALAAALDPFQIDVVVQPLKNRRKKLLIADMDSTIIEQECIDELADFAGLRAEISAITERAMRGELDFEAALAERVKMLAGLDESVLEETFRKRITLTPGARSLVRTMQAQGAFTALVSGGFTFFTQRVAAAAGFDVQRANTLLVRDGRLSGEVAPPILGRDQKEASLREFAAGKAIPLAETLAVGDGANDLGMLSAAGLGVAYHAKPAVADAADACIRFSDLSALLYIQGVPQSAFAK